MTSETGAREEGSQPESETSGSLVEGCESTRNEQLLLVLGLRTSPSCTLTVGFDA